MVRRSLKGANNLSSSVVAKIKFCLEKSKAKICSAWWYSVCTLFSVEYSKEGVDQILWQHVSFIHKDSHLIVHDDRQEDLFKESVSILDGGAVDFKERTLGTIAVFQVGCVLLGELGLAQSFCTAHHQERSHTSFVLRFGEKAKLGLNLDLTDKVVKHGTLNHRSFSMGILW